MSSADGLELRGDALVLAGALDRASVPALAARLKRLATRTVRHIDLSRVTRVDSAGAAFVAELRMRFGGAPLVAAAAEVAAVLEQEAPPLTRRRPYDKRRRRPYDKSDVKVGDSPDGNHR